LKNMLEAIVVSVSCMSIHARSSKAIFMSGCARQKGEGAVVIGDCKTFIDF
jgi:hypothetical protein